MPTRRPVTPIVEPGVPLRDAAKDAELIQQLMTRLPNDLGASVLAVVGRGLTTDLRAALGAPDTIIEHFVQVAKESGTPVNEKELTQSIEAALQGLGGDSGLSVEPAIVQEELEHAKHALVTHWLSLLITAWDLWGRPAEGLALDPKTLVPDSSTCPRKEAWRNAVVSLHEALTSNVALDIERDVPRALGALASSVCAEAQRHVVSLPRGFALKSSDRGVRLHHEPPRDAERAVARSQS